MQTAISNTFPLTGSSAFGRSMTGRVVLALTATLVVAAAAHISIPLWFTPVPLTLQPLAVLVVGLALGPVAGFFAMLAYLAEGAMGAPVFAPSPLGGGVAQLFGPTGGFLMAYPLVAAIAGGLTEVLSKRTAKFVAAAIGCVAASLVLFACGAGWLMAVMHLSARQTWAMGVAPFLPGAVIHVVVAAGFYRAVVRPARGQ